MTNGKWKIGNRLLSNRKLKHSIRSIEHRLHCAIHFTSGDLAAPEHLDVSALKLEVHKNRHQILAESIHVIEVRQRTGKLVRGCLLHSLQSGYCSRFQGTAGAVTSGGGRLEDELAKRQCHPHAALSVRFFCYFRAVEFQAPSAVAC